VRLEPHIEALQAELASLASLGDENVAAAAERLSQALGNTLGLRLLSVISEAALEVSSQLPAGQVEVRLAGQEPSLVYVEAEGAPPAPPSAEDGLTARITLRLPDSLKVSLEAAAGLEGVSVNAWIIRALARFLSSPPSGSGIRVGNRLTGYGRS
jgi:predicted HicB family RNase H-like nuclease